MSQMPTWLRHGLLVGALLVVLAGVFWHTRTDGRLRIFFLDTPGDAVLIQTPAGGFVLIDGGEDPSELALHLGRALPFWERRLVAVVLTRAERARLPGQVAALARYRADLVLAPAVWRTPDGETLHITQPAPDTASANVLMEEWLHLIDTQRTRLLIAQPGYRLALGGAVLSVLTTGDEDESRLVLQLDYGATRVLLAGAASEADDTALLASAQPVTLLAYPWQREMHTLLMEAWQPRAIVFTTAYEAARPAELTYFERSAYGSALYHQRLDGTVELVSDGRQSWIHTEQTEPQ